KVEPRWPEPARFTAVRAFSRHMSARSARSFPSARTRSNSTLGMSSSRGIVVTLFTMSILPRRDAWPVGGNRRRETRALVELVRLLAEEERLGRARPVVGKPSRLAPARPRELHTQRWDRGNRLCLAAFGWPAIADEGVVACVHRRLE